MLKGATQLFAYIDGVALGHGPVAQGHYEQAAQLFGAAEALRETLALRRPAVDQVEHERRVASTGEALGDAAFGAAWAQGRAMTLEQAIEYALAAESEPPGGFAQAHE